MVPDVKREPTPIPNGDMTTADILVETLRVIHTKNAFSDLFLKFKVARAIRMQADLVDQLFNSSERRLARILLLMSEYGQPGEPTALISPITQEMLAEMIGTTRSRGSFFMNRFRRLGYIQYKGAFVFTSRCSMRFFAINCLKRIPQGPHSLTLKRLVTTPHVGG